MVGWHHGLSGHGSEQTLGDSEGQGSLACCSPWDHRVGHYLATRQQQMSILETTFQVPTSQFQKTCLKAKLKRVMRL